MRPQHGRHAPHSHTGYPSSAATRHAYAHWTSGLARNAQVSGTRPVPAEARRAFEHLTDVIWRRLVKVSCGEVHLKHKGPKVPTDLRDLKRLLKQLGNLPDDSSNATIRQLRQLRDHYAFVLQQPNHSILNTATHETADREDIDPNKAEDVLDALKKIETCLGTG